MAKPIKHDAGSGLVTAGWESLKGIGKGFATVIAGPALVLGAAGAAAGGALFALGALAVGTATAVGFGTVIGAGLLGAVMFGAAGAAIGAGGGTAGAIFFAGPIAAFGSLLGLARGGQRISQENAAARKHMERTANTQAMRDAEIFQAGQHSVVNAIQQEMEQHAAAQSKIDPKNFKPGAAGEHGHAQTALNRKAEAAKQNEIGG